MPSFFVLLEPLTRKGNAEEDAQPHSTISTLLSSNQTTLILRLNVILHPICLQLIIHSARRFNEVGIYPSHLTSSNRHSCGAATN